MRRLLLIILALATLLPSLAQAYDILVLQSRRDPAYEEALRGFRSANRSSQRTIVLSDYADVDVVRIVREDRPRVILAVGDAAMTAARTIRQTPVVALMALGIHKQRSTHNNLTGIDIFVSPERFIAVLKSMKARRVGVIYSQAKSGWYLHLAREAAEAAGIELVLRQVSAPHESIDRLASLNGKVDALWMVPDNTAITRETVEAYFRFGQEQNIPIVSFAASYLGLGAAAVLEIDRLAMGRQANVMVTKILNGNRVEDIPLDFPKGMFLKTNPSVMRHLSIAVNEEDSPLQ